MTGISQDQISLIERGMRNPSLSTRNKIENALGKIDWAETTGIQVRGSYQEAERLLKRLIGITIALDEKERKAIKRLIHKYY